MHTVFAVICVIFISVTCGQHESHGGELPDSPVLYFSEEDGSSPTEGRGVSLINDRPYMMSMKMKPHWYSKYIHCDAAVVGDRWAMTSARCCVKKCGTPYDPDKLCLRSGTARMDSETPEHKVDKIILMDGYHVDGMENNMCLIKFQADLNFGQNLKALVLAELDDYTHGVFGKITGWSSKTGKSSNPLMTSTLPLVSNARCKELWGNANAITENMACVVTEQPTMCHGSAGGPLVIEGRLAGIATRGYGCDNKPGVFTKVANFRNWILQHIGGGEPEGEIDVRLGLGNSSHGQ